MSGLAAPRDASWYDHPNVSEPKVRHAATDDGTPRCSPTCVLLDMDSAVALADVPHSLRCRRPACRAAYEAATPTPEHDRED